LGVKKATLPEQNARCKKNQQACARTGAANVLVAGGQSVLFSRSAVVKTRSRQPIAAQLPEAQNKYS
jgi:hypothetical protein